MIIYKGSWSRAVISGWVNDCVLRNWLQDKEKGSWVKRETVEKLHMELISDEEYMAGANQYWDEKDEQSSQE